VIELAGQHLLLLSLLHCLFASTIRCIVSFPLRNDNYRRPLGMR
jgi:hypothetical protein